MITIDTIKNVPSVERWTDTMETSSPEEALRLWQSAIECLDATNKSNRRSASNHSEELCKKRNEIERLFRRLKGFRRIFSRFETLDILFTTFIHFALIVEALRIV